MTRGILPTSFLSLSDELCPLYQLTFTSYLYRKSGHYELSISLYGKPIKGSPFQLTVYPGEVCKDHCKLVGMGMGNTDTTVVAVAGEETSFKIETADVMGNVRTFSKAEASFIEDLHSARHFEMAAQHAREVPAKERRVRGGGHRERGSVDFYNGTSRSRNSSFSSMGSIGSVVSDMAEEREAASPPSYTSVTFSYKVVDLEDGSVVVLYKFDNPGLYEVTISYKNQPLKSGQFQLLVISSKVSCVTSEYVAAKHCVLRGELIVQGEDPRSVTILLSQHQLVIKHYYGPLNLLSSRLFTAKVRPRLRLFPHPDSDEVISIVVGGSTALTPSMALVMHSVEDRNALYYTFLRFLHLNIGCSTEAFSDKYRFFAGQIRSLHSSSSHDRVTITVDRSKVLSSSFEAMSHLRPQEWRQKLVVSFEGEAGYDAGGLTREFYHVLSRALFSPVSRKGCGLFHTLGSERGTLLHPNRYWLEQSGGVREAHSGSSGTSSPMAGFGSALSDAWRSSATMNNVFQELLRPGSRPKHRGQLSLQHFRFAGQVLAKSVYDSIVHFNCSVNVHFTRSFYKLMLGDAVSYYDFAIDDPELYTCKIRYMVNNDINSLDLGLSFEDEDVYPDGSVVTEPLKLNGSSIPVTEDNKLEYLQLLAERRLSGVVAKETAEFTAGFYSVLPEELVSIFDENELELLVCGMPKVSSYELLQHIHWTGFEEGDREGEWFKMCVEGFSQEECARLLQFITGSSQVPTNGFGSIDPPLKVKKWSSTNARDHLPRVSTCFNTVLLPNYSTYEKLHQQLLTAITEGTEGFGFA
jgi:hypothetical protein